jgi:hypothetical protein
VQGLTNPLLFALAEDEVTGTDATIHRVIIGIERAPTGDFSALSDWEVLLCLNEVQPSSGAAQSLNVQEASKTDQLIERICDQASVLALPFRRPKLTPVMAMLPDAPIGHT